MIFNRGPSWMIVSPREGSTAHVFIGSGIRHYLVPVWQLIQVG
jgi:hypothetical protein